ncbi:MAG: DNA gyrase subunit A [Anaerobutyricum sp.]
MKNRQSNRLVITEIPYTMIGAGIANFLNDVALLVDSKQIPDIVDISNQSSKEGLKIVLDLKKNVSEEDAEKIKTILLSKTKLEDTFGVNMLAIADGRPETLSLKSALEYHINFLFDVNQRKYTTMLTKENEKAEVQEGLIKAIDVLDAVIETIRGSKTKAEAKECLMTGKVDNVKYRIAEDKKVAKTFDFTEMQADAILDMRLSRLIGLELEALKKENEKTKKNIEKYTKILSDKKYMKKVIKDDLERIIKEYGQPRKTSIKNIAKAVIKKEAPKAFKEVVLMDKFGYVRAVSDTVYEKNKEAADSESKWVIPVMSDDKVVFITENGIMHTVPANKIPFGKFRDKSIPVDNVSTLDTTTDLILYAEAMKNMACEKVVNNYIMVTNLGGVKKLPGIEFNVKSKNTKYIKLKDGEVCTNFVKVEKSEPEIVAM